ncbi:GNAT family N-acetyltransferase [Microbacterium indicum]|uniref:GNAT family N-acetyltransferase n=1 Tax=Microbacterium indicum TaxID=358100 RepID=UPI0003FDD7E8|nr:GNAT family N-acetyltransferase [Microbacterium indicum]
MTDGRPTPLVRAARRDDMGAVGAALRTYLVQTEEEKAERGIGEPRARAGELPARYREEAADPAGALPGCPILVAELDGAVVGVVVLKPGREAAEIKRLWVSPDVRGRGAGSALLDAAIAASGPLPVMLTVWDWRRGAIRLYESHGFARSASWDARPRLICMRRDAGAPAAG